MLISHQRRDHILKTQYSLIQSPFCQLCLITINIKKLEYYAIVRINRSRPTAAQIQPEAIFSSFSFLPVPWWRGEPGALRKRLCRICWVKVMTAPPRVLQREIRDLSEPRQGVHIEAPWGAQYGEVDSLVKQPKGHTPVISLLSITGVF